MPRYTYKFIYPDRVSHPAVLPGPYLPVRVWNPHDNLYMDTYALVDTGADSCLVPGWLAEMVGHNLQGDAVDKSSATGIADIKVQTYKHTFAIEIFNPTSTSIVWRSKSSLLNCVEDPEGYMILGAWECLSAFRWTIDYRKSEFAFEWKGRKKRKRKAKSRKI